MENMHDLLLHRHSIRKYSGEPISPEQVKLILEAALMAPSSKRSMPWEFVLVEDKATLEELSFCKDMGAKPIAGASLAIAVVADPEKSEAWVEDSSCAALLMQLQAEDLGLGSCWIQIRDRFGAELKPAEEYVRELLDIPETLRVLCIVTFGHKAEERKPFDPEKMMWEKVHADRW